MAPIDNGEEKIERVASDVTRSGAQVSVRFVAARVDGLSKAIASKGLSMAATSLKWTMAAVQKPGGQVSMKELSELPSRAGREVVSLDDKDVMQALEKNLKGRGVHYAIEREKIDGKVQHILHVRGDDGQVVADSLERAAEAVDAKRERKQDRNLERDDPKQTQKQGQPSDSGAPKQEQSEAAPKAGDSRTGEATKAPEQGKDLQQKTSEGVKPKKAETAPDAKRSKAETEQMQKELRQKVKTRAAEIKAEAPKKAPKLDVPSQGLKR